MLNKLAITAELIHHFPDAPNLEEAMTTWWQNRREDGGLRLTHIGYQIFSTQLELQSWQFDLPDQFLSSRTLLAMDRHMTCPYYIVSSRKTNKLVMFGSRESMMAALHGNMNKFIQSLTY